MKKEITFEEILKNLKKESSIIDELKFTEQEIHDNLFDLINYVKNEKEHNESSETCCVNHYNFVRDENGRIYTKHVFCNKQRKENSINDNILISDYIHNDDYQKILKNSKEIYHRTNKRLKFVDYFKKNFSDLKRINDPAENCFLYGEVLSGKSFSGFYLLKSCLHFKADKKIAYINAKVFCNKIADSYSNISLKEQVNQYLDILLNVDYLFIDDLGTEKQSQSSLNKLSYLLKERTKSKAKTTILISSKNIDNLKKYYSKLDNIDYDYVNDIICRIKEIAKENIIEIDKVI